MRRFYSTLIFCLVAITSMAQGWPENYKGVMLQGFYWDSYNDSQWVRLEKQADDFAPYFDLIWIPQSGNCGGTSMGYDDLYWFTNYNSSFGNEAELRSMITTFKNKGIGTIADVVINHRRNVSSWTDFPAETYNGVTYQLTYNDICSNDEAAKNGYQVGPNKDTGEGWDGMRDLDHKSENVQTNVKAYLKFLLNDLGYTGFRYDMVKGYAAEYTKMYNEDSKPQFSVGECWDSSNTIQKWIDGTDKTSAAFDFQFKYVVRNATDKQDWSYLNKQNDGNWPLVSSNFQSGNYRQYAVTFVENHDTEVRPDGSSNGPLKKDTLAANAYMLAMPGTPCVFLKHWQAYKPEIKAMIDARKLAGISNTSTYQRFFVGSPTMVSTEYYGCTVDDKLVVVVGNTSKATPDADKWTKILSGYHYVYYLAKSLETAWADKASGKYEEAFKVKLIAVSADDNAKLVYTLDGTDPTASSTKVDNGTSIDITTDCTLKVGLLVGSTVKAIATRTYTFNKIEKQEISIYVNADKVSWTAVNFWSWGGDGSHAPKNSSWPGDKVTETTTIGGKTWFSKKFTINSEDDAVSFVFSTGTGSPQTVDVTNVTKTSYFEISTDKDGEGKYKVNNVTDNYTGIRAVEADAEGLTKVYTLDGRLVRTVGKNADALSGMAKGIYIVNKKKFIVK